MRLIEGSHCITGEESAVELGAPADLVGLPNHAVAIGEEIAGDFDRIVADLDEPFADPSSFPCGICPGKRPAM